MFVCQRAEVPRGTYALERLPRFRFLRIANSKRANGETPSPRRHELIFVHYDPDTDTCCTRRWP